MSQRKCLAYGTCNTAALPSKMCIFQISRWSMKHCPLPCCGNRPCLFPGTGRDSHSLLHQKHGTHTGELNSCDLTVRPFLTWLTKSPPPGKTIPLTHAHQNLDHSFINRRLTQAFLSREVQQSKDVHFPPNETKFSVRW